MVEDTGERAAKRPRMSDSTLNSDVSEVVHVTADPAATSFSDVTQVTEKNLEIFNADLPESVKQPAISHTVAPSNGATGAESTVVVENGSTNVDNSAIENSDTAPMSQDNDNQGRVSGVAQIKPEYVRLLL